MRRLRNGEHPLHAALVMLACIGAVLAAAVLVWWLVWLLTTGA